MIFSRFVGFLSSINNEFNINILRDSNYNFYVDSDLIDYTSKKEKLILLVYS